MNCSQVPATRIAVVNHATVNPNGEYVLYWMIAARRARHNFALQRAVEWAEKLAIPLVVFEALRSDYRWASDRMHRFVMQGMADNQRDFAKTPAFYYPYVEPKIGDGSGLLDAWAKLAAVVVTDDFPCFFLPRMVRAAGRKLRVKLEAIDSNGLLPLRAAEKVFARAVDFRRFLQHALPDHLENVPKVNPLARCKIPTLTSPPLAITKRWPAAGDTLLKAERQSLADLPIDHQVSAANFDGGAAAAKAALDEFLRHRLQRYAEFRNHPDENAASGLSPYLHFGHLSAHEIFAEIVKHEAWNPGRIAKKVTAAREGWWGMTEQAEAFLDEFITWRELGYNMCSKRDDYAEYESLPDWAKQTLAKHAKDKRPRIYELDELEHSKTYDPLWNAAQTQLRNEGRMHNYLRMLWGKKILEWSPSPQLALQAMIELNNKYAVDGRNPNSYSGIFWVLGRYDRPWGPERPIFGTIRYMTSDSTMRKLKLKNYLAKYSARERQPTLPNFS